MKKNNYFITVQNDILESDLISSRAKLLYGYIVSLSQRKGYCFATNKHFAEKFGVCRKTVTRDLNELSKASCIETKVIVEENGNRLRYIFPLSCPVGRAHSSEGQVRTSPAPQDKDALHYTIKGNKKNISSYESKRISIRGEYGLTLKGRRVFGRRRIGLLQALPNATDLLYS